MVIYNAATRELTAKIVYYGPGLCGKTTNLKVLHDRLEPGTVGKLLNLRRRPTGRSTSTCSRSSSATSRATRSASSSRRCPGQTAFNETRRVVLKGVGRHRLRRGLAVDDAAEEPRELAEPEGQPASPTRSPSRGSRSSSSTTSATSTDILSVDAMQEALGLSSYPFVEAVASAGPRRHGDLQADLEADVRRPAAAPPGPQAPRKRRPPPRAAEEARQDDLQTWKDSLLKRDSQADVQAPAPLAPALARAAASPTRPRSTRPSSAARPTPRTKPRPTPCREPPGLEPGSPDGAHSAAVGHDRDRRRSAWTSSSIRADGAGAPHRGGPRPRIRRPAGAPRARSVRARGAAGRRESGGPIPRSCPPAPKPGPPASAWRCSSSACASPRAAPARERESAPSASTRPSPPMHERVAATTEHLAALGDRLEALEKGVGGLHEALGALAQRLVPVERASEARAGLEAGIQRRSNRRSRPSTSASARGAARQRKDADDLGMALGTLNEKALVVEQQMAVLLSPDGHARGPDERPAAARGASIAARWKVSRGARRRSPSRLPRLEGQLGGAVRPGRPPAPARGPGRGRAAPAPRARVDVRREDPAGPPRGRGHPLPDRAAARGARPAARVGRPALRRDASGCGSRSPSRSHDLAERLRQRGPGTRRASACGCPELLRLRRRPRSCDRNRSSLRQSGSHRTVSSRKNRRPELAPRAPRGRPCRCRGSSSRPCRR